MRSPKKGIQPIDRELWKAAATNMPTAVRLLLAEGAIPNFKNANGRTALIMSCYQGHERCIEALASVSDCGIKDRNGWDAWDYCHWKSKCALLLVPFIDLHAASKVTGETPWGYVRGHQWEERLNPQAYSQMLAVAAAMEARELSASSAACVAVAANARRL